jgi:hypothetical protein
VGNTTYALTDTGGPAPGFTSLVMSNFGNAAWTPKLATVANEWWTITAVPAPDMTRAAAVLESVPNNQGAYLKSYVGNYLNYGTYCDAACGSKGGALDTFEIHLTTSPTSIMLNLNRDKYAAYPITFGEALFLQMGTGPYPQTSPFFLGPASVKSGFVVLPSVLGLRSELDSRLWTLNDSSGRYKTGDRVPFGAKLMVKNKSAATQLSADTSAPRLLLTPATGAPEQWTIVK